MRRQFLMLMLASVLMLLPGCNKEQRCIDKLEKLVSETEQKADQLDKEKWQEAVAKYQDLCAEIEKYSYTDEQLQHIGRLKGRFYAVAAKYHLNGKGGLLNTAVQEGMGILESLWNAADEELGTAIDGIRESLNGTEDTQSREEQDLKELEELFE